jgi:hypothetical protein
MKLTLDELLREGVEFPTPTLIPGADMKHLMQSEGAKRMMGIRRMHRRVVTHVDKASEDSEMLSAQKSLRNDLLSKDDYVATSDNDHFAGPNAMGSDFSTLYVVAGRESSPASVPQANNTVLREQLGLPNQWKNKAHVQIFNEMFEHTLRECETDTIRVAKDSQSGFEDFTHDSEERLEIAENALVNANKIIDAYWRGDLEEARRLGVVTCFFTGARRQADRRTYKDGQWIRKDRFGFDWDYAVTQGLKGTRVPTSKDPGIPGSGDDFDAERIRVVHGLNLSSNAILASFMAPMMERLFQEYSYTFHTTTDLLEKVQDSGLTPRGVDATQYDETMPYFMVQAACRSLLELGMNEKYVYFLLQCYLAPMFAGGRALGERNIEGNFIGNPLDQSTFTVFRGQPSGIWTTSFFNKLMMAGTSMCWYHDVGGQVIGNVDSILKGEDPFFKMINNGDDHIKLLSDVYAAKWDKKPEYTYFSVEQESPIRFGGEVLFRDSAGDMRKSADLVSFVTGVIVPERSIYSNFRKFPGVGFADKISHYGGGKSGHPLFADVFSRYRYYFSKAIGGDVDKMWTSMRESEEAVLAQLKNFTLKDMTSVDIDVLTRPERRFFRYSLSEISEGVIDLLEMRTINSIPKEEVWT